MYTFDENYDDYCSFYEEEDEGILMYADDEDYYEDMDGDHESGFASAGWGVDESYESETPMYEDYYGGE